MTQITAKTRQAGIRVAGAILAWAVFFGASGPQPAMAQGDDSGTDINYGLAGQMVPLTGPRKTVSVGQVNSMGGFSAFYGDWDVGGGVAAMLISALRETGHFVVLERASLSQVLSEQELTAGGLTRPGTGPQAGQMVASQLLVVASITEFGTQESGGGVSVGIVGGPLGDRGSGALARQHAKGKVAMDVRLINTATTEVIGSVTVSEKIKDSSVSLDIGYDVLSFGTNRFTKTPLGEATRNMVADAARKIADLARAMPWTGQVVEADSQTVIINGGSQIGVQQGDTFLIERLERTFTDPATGEVLGAQKRSIGTATISVVQPRMSYGAFTPQGEEVAKRGDDVRPYDR